MRKNKAHTHLWKCHAARPDLRPAAQTTTTMDRYPPAHNAIKYSQPFDQFPPNARKYIVVIKMHAATITEISTAILETIHKPHDKTNVDAAMANIATLKWLR
jgi:hypothetical protein